jgi:aspartate racemase
MLGILGGMGPAATADFMNKLIQLTPATCDQEHIPMLITNLPQTPDRSENILGAGSDPLPMLLKGIAMLNAAGVGAIAIPCNSSHHWYEQLSAASTAPILHIVRATVPAIPIGTKVVAVLATRGALKSGIYQRELDAAGFDYVLPDAGEEQAEVDATIRSIKAGQNTEGGAHLQRSLNAMQRRGASAAIMACTEISIAARHITTPTLCLVDTNLELARTCVQYALARNWNRVS